MATVSSGLISAIPGQKKPERKVCGGFRAGNSFGAGRTKLCSSTMLLLENDQQFSDSLLRERPLSTGFLNCPLLTQLRAVAGAPHPLPGCFTLKTLQERRRTGKKIDDKRRDLFCDKTQAIIRATTGGESARTVGKRNPVSVLWLSDGSRWDGAIRSELPHTHTTPKRLENEKENMDFVCSSGGGKISSNRRL